MYVQKMRLKRGWSQQQLAEVSGLSLRTVQRIESGAMPSLESLKSLASVFEVSIEDLQEGTQMSAGENNESEREALALAYGRELRGFYVHVTIYVIVCLAILAANLLLFPERLLALLVWLIWGAGLAIHAVNTFIFNGVWERRQVERKLGRTL
ncbi:MAG: helix-turn-helix domain-containing protein [Steroidobacteraceae bacterium]